MTFTHRVTTAELDAEALDEMPDLSVVLWNSGRDGLPLDDGSGSIRTTYEEMSNPRIAGPLGWIEAVRPGDIGVFTRTDRVVSVEVIDEDELGDGLTEMEALTAAASGWIGDGRGSEELPVVMEAMARNPALFRRPVSPLGELLSAIGLERRGIEWGWAAEEWDRRRAQRSLSVRVGKKFNYATGPDGHDTMFGLALSAAGDRDDVVEAIRQFLVDPFLVDVAVHEGGLGEEYGDQRGPLLAADEVELLEQVLDEPRRLWEITGVVEGESLSLRDTGSGDELTVTEHSGSEGREVGVVLQVDVGWASAAWRMPPLLRG